MTHIKEILDRIVSNLYIQKEVLSFREACKYCELSESTMYRHTSNRKIPHYKPEGKNIYFHRLELDQWMLRNRQATQDELMHEASKCSTNSKTRY